MTYVYGDISGDETGILTAGCYLGREEDWQRATRVWKQVCDDAGVAAFHATDFYNAMGEFDSDEWRREVPGRGLIPGGPKHDAFAARFSACAADARLVGFAFAMDVGPFNEILAPVLATERRQHRLDDPRTHTVMSSLARVGGFLERASYPDRRNVQVVFEDEQGAGRFISVFDEASARGKRWTQWFHSFTTGPKSFVRLQMADLLAHEAWRRVKETVAENPPRVRRSFERMLVGEHIEVRWFGEQHARQHARESADLLTRYPDGLVPIEDTRPPR